MTEFDPEKFDDKYVHYFEELEAAYSTAYQRLHGRHESTLLRAVDRQILAESEPVYEGDGEFSVRLPPDVDDRLDAVAGERETVESLLETFTSEIERELRRTFGFEGY